MRETSIEAYRKITENGLLSKRRMEAYKILFHHGPLTSNEIFKYVEDEYPGGFRHNANARMSELRHCGVAKEVGTKVCTVTGHTVILWDVTTLADPLKIVRPPSKVKLLESQIRFLKEEKARLETICRQNGIDPNQDALPF